MAYVYVDILDALGPVQSVLRAIFGWRSAADYWFPDVRSLGGAVFVIGDRPTIADVSLCGYLFWPEEIGVDWDGYPHLRDWLLRIRALPRWTHPYELMPGHPRPAPGCLTSAWNER